MSTNYANKRSKPANLSYYEIPLRSGEWRCDSIWCVGLPNIGKTCVNCGGRNPNIDKTIDATPELVVEAIPIVRKKKTGKKRGHYQHVSKEAKLQILNLYINHDKSSKEISLLTGVKQGTIDYYASRLKNSGLIIEDLVEGKRKTGRKRKFTDAEEQMVVNYIQEENDITDKEIKKRFKEATGKSISKGSLYRILKANKITSKNIYPEPVERNLPETIEARRIYSLEMAHIDPADIIFIDETGWNVKQHRRRGRSKKGTKAVYRVKNRGQQSANVSCIGAFSPVFGMIHYELRLGSTDHKVYANFVTELARKPICKQKQFLLVHDNYGVHKHADIRNALDTFPIDHHIKQLPIYSPQLNPIENYWGKITNLLNTRLGGRDNRPSDNETFMGIITDIIDNETPEEEWKNFYKKVMEHYIDCVAGKPLQD
jgi:transposase